MRTDGVAELPRVGPLADEPDHAHPSPSVLFAGHPRGLERITDPQIQAVIWVPRPVPSWLEECADAVRDGRLTIARTNRSGLTRAEIEALVGELVPDGLPFSADLRSDLLGLADHLERISGRRRFQLRIFTEAPSTRCGFHVDTVPPGLPPFGLMRVYAGSPTQYADRRNIVSIASFHRYMSRRERLLRDINDGANEGALARLIELDRSPEFLCDRADLRVTAPGAVVAFRHLDAADHWNCERGTDAWIHCSPMTGERRLVVNVCPSR